MTFLERFFGEFCFHRFTWPRLSGNGQHSQICLICGTTSGYDWTRKQRSDRLLVTNRQHALASSRVPAEFGPKYTPVLANGRSALVRSNTLEANSREGLQPPRSGTLIQRLKGFLPLQAPPSNRG